MNTAVGVIACSNHHMTVDRAGLDTRKHHVVVLCPLLSLSLVHVQFFSFDKIICGLIINGDGVALSFTEWAVGLVQI